MKIATTEPKFNLRLSEIARDPVVKAFFRRGEDGEPLFETVSLTPPLPPAPAIVEVAA